MEKTTTNFDQDYDIDKELELMQQLHIQGKQQYNSTQTNRFYQLIPKAIRLKFQQSCAPEQFLFKCLTNLHTYSKIQELHLLFQQIGADLSIWNSKLTAEEKGEYLLDALQKNIQQNLKKINTQSSNYMNVVNNNRKAQKQSKLLLQKQKNNDFEWLALNTKNQMLKSKLKTKLVQTINEYKNEKKLREVMGKKLQDHQKIHLEDQSIDFYQQQKDKVNYQWTIEDENMFLQNIRKLKDKFIRTQFLKNCHRYKFITDSELKTLAAQQISRKLDKSNKAFLSRQFLLDKYFSTKQNLTDKQMKFILKTSPLLSKCVDKAFVRAAIKNIRYEDIDKMELQIAEQIIDKFQMIRNEVKQSRKFYKQRQNKKTKCKIQKFQKQKQFNQKQQLIINKLNSHKVKMIRNLNFRPSTSKINRENKQNFRNYDDQQRISKKMEWPIPLNNYHPSTGLFIKDCSQQINQQLNDYEKNYIKSIPKGQDKKTNINTLKDDEKSKIIKFYTGGPLDNFNGNKNFNFSSSSSGFAGGKQGFDPNCFKILCQAFKTAQYRKQITYKLNNIQLNENQEIQSPANKILNSLKPFVDYCFTQFSKKSKRSNTNDEQDLSFGPLKKLQSSTTQKVIKDKILQGRQKAKMTVYIRKLLSLAAQNAFMALKALNIKFTPSQVNTTDSKGNTALFYATKHKNMDFIDYLLAMKADVNIRCSKGTTPLHNAFKSSNYAIICKCLLGTSPPNLNALDDQRKTPLAYCCQKVLKMLGLQQGVVYVEPNQKMKFDNNSLLCLKEQPNNCGQELEMKFDMKRKSKPKQTPILV